MRFKTKDRGGGGFSTMGKFRNARIIITDLDIQTVEILIYLYL